MPGSKVSSYQTIPSADSVSFKSKGLTLVLAGDLCILYYVPTNSDNEEL